MPRNIEIKARIESVARMLPLARALADGPETLIEQDDSFYRCARGRLKLRRFAAGDAELIHYERANAAGPKLSDYVRVPIGADQVASLDEALHRAHGRIGRVKKRRWLLLAGPTRIHLDEVHGLGEFLELEVVLADTQTEAEGEAIAHALMQRLGVGIDALLTGAYLDLLVAGAKA
jgi:adenylate cyclase class IV